MIDIISITSLIVSSITAIGVIIHQFHLKNCGCLCVESECYKSQPNTPIVKEPLNFIV